MPDAIATFITPEGRTVETVLKAHVGELPVGRSKHASHSASFTLELYNNVQQLALLLSEAGHDPEGTKLLREFNALLRVLNGEDHSSVTRQFVLAVLHLLSDTSTDGGKLRLKIAAQEFLELTAMHSRA